MYLLKTFVFISEVSEVYRPTQHSISHFGSRNSYSYKRLQFPVSVCYSTFNFIQF